MTRADAQPSGSLVGSVVVHLCNDSGIGLGGWGIACRRSPLTSSYLACLGVVVVYLCNDSGIDVCDLCADDR
jgi:hypothetical protein